MAETEHVILEANKADSKRGDSFVRLDSQCLVSTSDSDGSGPTACRGCQIGDVHKMDTQSNVMSGKVSEECMQDYQ